MHKLLLIIRSYPTLVSDVQVQRKLEPLEKAFWAKALAGTGFAQEAKREKSKLLSVQQAELGSLSLELRRCENPCSGGEQRVRLRQLRGTVPKTTRSFRTLLIVFAFWRDHAGY